VWALILMISPCSLSFVADLEERTDGEIRIEYIGGNQLGRLTMKRKFVNGFLNPL